MKNYKKVFEFIIGNENSGVRADIIDDLQKITVEKKENNFYIVTFTCHNVNNPRYKGYYYRKFISQDISIDPKQVTLAEPTRKGYIDKIIITYEEPGENSFDRVLTMWSGKDIVLNSTAGQFCCCDHGSPFSISDTYDFIYMKAKHVDLPIGSIK